MEKRRKTVWHNAGILGNTARTFMAMVVGNRRFATACPATQACLSPDFPDGQGLSIHPKNWPKELPMKHGVYPKNRNVFYRREQRN
jgi:hypothetical protein